MQIRLKFFASNFWPLESSLLMVSSHLVNSTGFFKGNLFVMSGNMQTLVKPKSCWWCTLLKIFFTLYCSTGIIIREYSKKYCSFYSAGVVVFASVRRTFLDGKPSYVYKRDYCSFQSLDILPCGILLFQFCWRQLAKHCVCRGSIYLK